MKKTVTSIIALSMVPLATAGLAQDSQVQPGYITIVPPPSVPSLSSFRLETIRARDEDLLRALASAIKMKHADLLEGTQILFTRIESHGTVFYRMDIQGVEDEKTARELCQILEMNQCLVSRPGASVLAGDVQGMTVMPDGLVDVGVPSGSPSGSLEMVPLPTVNAPAAPSMRDLERLSRLPVVRPDFVMPPLVEEKTLALPEETAPSQVESVDALEAQAEPVSDEAEVPMSDEAEGLTLPGDSSANDIENMIEDMERAAPQEDGENLKEGAMEETSLEDVLFRRPTANAPLPVLELTTDRPKVKTETEASSDDMQITLVDQGALSSALPPVVEDEDVAGLIKSALEEKPLPMLRPDFGALDKQTAQIDSEDVDVVDSEVLTDLVEQSESGTSLNADEGESEAVAAEVETPEADAPLSEEMLAMSKVRPQMRPAGMTVAEPVLVEEPAPAVEAIVETAEATPESMIRPMLRPEKQVVAQSDEIEEKIEEEAPQRTAYGRPVIGPQTPEVSAPNGSVETSTASLDTPRESRGAKDAPRVAATRSVERVNSNERLTRRPIAFVTPGATVQEAFEPLPEKLTRLPMVRPMAKKAESVEVSSVRSDLKASTILGATAVSEMSAFAPSVDGEEVDVALTPTLSPADDAFKASSKRFVAASQDVMDWSKMYTFGPALRPAPDQILGYLEIQEESREGSWASLSAEKSRRSAPVSSQEVASSEAAGDVVSQSQGPVSSPVAQLATGETVESSRKEVVVSEISEQEKVANSKSTVATETALDIARVQEGVSAPSAEVSDKAQATQTTSIQMSTGVRDVALKNEAEEEVLAQAGDTLDKAVAPVLSESFEMPAIWVDGPKIETSVAENESTVSAPVQGEAAVQSEVAELATASKGANVARLAKAQEASDAPIATITESFEAPAIFIPQMVTMTKPDASPAVVASFAPIQSVTLKAHDASSLPSAERLSARAKEESLVLARMDIPTVNLRPKVLPSVPAQPMRQAKPASLVTDVVVADMEPVSEKLRTASVLEKIEPAFSDVSEEDLALSKSNIPTVGLRPSLSDVVVPQGVAAVRASQEISKGVEIVASVAPTVVSRDVVVGQDPSTSLARLSDAQAISGVEVVMLGENSSPFGPMVRPTLSDASSDETLLAALVGDAPIEQEVVAQVLETEKAFPMLRPSRPTANEEPAPQVQVAVAQAQVETPVQRADMSVRVRMDIVEGQNSRPVDQFLAELGVHHPLSKEEMATGLRVASLGPVELNMSDVSNEEAQLPSGVSTFAVKKEENPSLALAGFIEKIQNEKMVWATPSVVDLAAWSGSSDESEILKGEEALPNTIVATVGRDGIEMRTPTRRIVVPNKAPHPMGRFAVVLDDTFALPFDLSGIGRLPLQKTPMMRPQVVEETNAAASEPTVELLAAGGSVPQAIQEDIATWFPVSKVTQSPVETQTVAALPADTNVDLRTALMASLEIVSNPMLPQNVPAAQVPEVSRPDLDLASPDGRPKAMGPFAPETVAAEPAPHDLRVGGVPIDQVNVAQEDLMIRLSYATEREAIDQEVAKLRATLPPALASRGKFFGQKVPASAGLFVVGIQADSMDDREELIAYFERNQIPYVLSNQSAASLLR